MGLHPIVRHRLSQARKAHGWSLRAAGREVGCCAAMVLMIERGDRIPGLPLAGRIAEAYDLDDVTRYHLMRRSHWLADPNRDPHEPDREDQGDDELALPPMLAGPAVHSDAAGRMAAATDDAKPTAPPGQSRPVHPLEGTVEL